MCVLLAKMGVAETRFTLLPEKSRQTKYKKQWSSRQRTSLILERWETRDFPGGPVVKNPPSNARDAGLIPGGRTKIPHAAGQLNLCTTTRAKPRSPLAVTREKPAMKSPHSPKKKRKKGNKGDEPYCCPSFLR